MMLKIFFGEEEDIINVYNNIEKFSKSFIRFPLKISDETIDPMGSCL